MDERKRPSPPPVPTTSSIERLRLSWDSESYADWPVAEPLSLISEIAYLDPFLADDRYRELGFVHIEPIINDSMIGYVMSADDVTVIAFRGTDRWSLSDWVVNGRFSTTNTPHGSIHKGFYAAYRSLKPQITKILGETRPKHLWITGHSLGGALALICAYDLSENENYSLKGIMTFGQPMVATTQLAEHLDQLLLGRYTFFVNGEDAVPRLPPGYAPCGSMVWFAKDGVKRSEPKRVPTGTLRTEKIRVTEYPGFAPLTDREYQELRTRLRAEMAEAEQLPDGTPVAKGDLPLIRDHGIELYCEKIHGLLKGTGSLPNSMNDSSPSTNP